MGPVDMMVSQSTGPPVKEDPLVVSVKTSYQTGGLRAAMLSFAAGRKEARELGWAQDFRSQYFSCSMYRQLALLQPEQDLGNVAAFHEKFTQCYRELALFPLFLSEVTQPC